MTKTGQHRYRIEVVTTRRTTGEQSTRALRAVLKALLRGFGYRCTSVERVPTAEPPDDDQ